MTLLVASLLATLSVWDYPARQVRHDALKADLVASLKTNDSVTAAKVCQAGTELLPDDPIWRYNYACQLALTGERERALDELAEAIDLGFRDAKRISGDPDLRPLHHSPRFGDLVEYAERVKDRQLLFGPLATMKAVKPVGSPVLIGEANVVWDLDRGAFETYLELVGNRETGNSFDLYFNRDGGHSPLKTEDFPGLTVIGFDQEGRSRKLDREFPNAFFPYPVFGNASLAFCYGPYWRSMPRALMTTDARLLGVMEKFYLDNQLWVFPAHEDAPPAGRYGDIFPAVLPYFFVTSGSSWSDQPYLRAALTASAALSPETKAVAVKAKLLSPTIMTLIRQTLVGITKDEDYLSEKAFPTTYTADRLDVKRLTAAAAALKEWEIPPLVRIATLALDTPETPSPLPELNYMQSYAASFMLRSETPVRRCLIKAQGAPILAFRIVHDPASAAKIVSTRPDSVEIEIDRTRLNLTNRVDLAVFGRRSGTAFGAPAFVSIAAFDAKASYVDPYFKRGK